MTEAELLPIIQRIEVLELRPDDTLLFYLPSHTTAESLARFTEIVRRRFPNALALCGVDEVSVVRETP